MAGCTPTGRITAPSSPGTGSTTPSSAHSSDTQADLAAIEERHGRILGAGRYAGFEEMLQQVMPDRRSPPPGKAGQWG
ncbi:hypothetical protein Msi02_81600 [Microbispora siamensis]|uniref:Transposase n=1 Tax=Microbispora siamensis TaxID=564413 RepID=A0ABQ4H0Z3_9ACTN|nr:hypothetical protein Msi02_81600 [Microbispora siamensis]